MFAALIESNITGTYFNFIQGMVASSVVLTVLVLNYHHRNPDTHNMPPWVGALYVVKTYHFILVTNQVFT